MYYCLNSGILPTFSANLDKISSKLKKSDKNTTGLLSLFPPQPLVRLTNLISKFKFLRQWRNSKPSDYSVFIVLFNLIRNSKKYFKKIIGNKFNIDPSTVVSKLNMDTTKFKGENMLEVISSTDDGDAKIQTNIIDTSDNYILYKVVPHIYRSNLPEIQYMIKSEKKVFLFKNKPVLNNCYGNLDDDDRTCTHWDGILATPSCVDYVLGQPLDKSTTCPMVKTYDQILAI